MNLQLITISRPAWLTFLCRETAVKRQTCKGPLSSNGMLNAGLAGAFHDAVGYQAVDSALADDAAVHAVAEVAVREVDPLRLAVEIVDDGQAG